jgi:hypothetical protein
MAKQTKPIQRTRKPVTQDNSIKDVIVIQDEIKLDLSIKMGDLAEMRVSDARTAILQMRADVNAHLGLAKATYADLEKKLSEQATLVVRDVESDAQAKTLAAALTAFTGEAYGITSDKATVSVKDQQVTTNVIVCTVATIESRSKSEHYYGRSGYSVDKNISRPFNTVMTQTVEQLRLQSEEIRRIEIELEKVHYLLADIPNMLSRAKSALTKACLRGELRTGVDLLRVLGEIEGVALPPVAQRVMLPYDTND